MSREKAFEQFKALQKHFTSHKNTLYEANEAESRLLLIDEILQILGWKKEEFTPEAFCGTAGYADYILSIERNPRFVVEAKKIGVTFGLPTSSLTSNEYTVSYLKKAFKKKLSDVIDQAQRYCVEKAVQYAVITNGAEWFVCPMLPKPGKTIDSMKGVYFGNIFGDEFSFDLLYDLISKDSTQVNRLDSYLSEINYTPSEVCFILKDHFNNFTWDSNKDNEWIDDFYQNFFSQITEKNQRKMLEHCFVSDSKLDQFKGEIKRALKDTKPSFLPNDALDLSPSEGKDFILEHNTGKVIIITGAVGCGKTTLVTKCLVEARRSKNIYATPIIIDLINDVSKFNIDVRNIVFDYLYEKIKNDYEIEFTLDELRITFAHEIKVLKNGSHKDIFNINPELFLLKEAEILEQESKNKKNMILRIFKKRAKENKSVIVIIDNVDRAAESFQEEIYALSHLITQESSATVIITLREFTFFKNKDKGFLDVRPEDKIIHLKSPDFNKLISTRIKYIKENLNEDFRLKDWRKKYDLDSFLEKMNFYADVLRKNIQLSNDAIPILEILSSVSWHNIRNFYQLIKHVHYQLGNNITWRKQDVISTLTYHPENTEKAYIPNVYLPYKNINQCYYLKLRILSFLNDAVSLSETARGISLERIIKFASLYGYQRAWIVDAIESSVKERIVECIELPSDSDLTIEYNAHVSHTFRISPLGTCLILDICHTPIYLCLSSIHLPFHEKKPYNETRDELGKLIETIYNDKRINTNHEIIDLVENSNIPTLISSYLTTEYGKEKLSLPILRTQTDVFLTEKRISKLVSSFNFSVGSKEVNNFIQERTKQINLPFNIDDIDDIDESVNSINNEKDIPSSLIPLNMNVAMRKSSEYIPLIFVALVIRAYLGHETSIGTEITETINDHLVNEDNKKFTNNVSRALRSNSLIKQKWLLIRTDLHHKFRKFSLNNEWQSQWVEIFEESPPDIKM
ncbi:AAA family ATPase [Klebsiella michiganensis]|uniref:AAA family ATPase n=1 Tax=Klebsiella michiganensis TaxID=1134687 RepID=UPI000667A102|nr:AAA family ATPase [Klebsiella michiganensis]